MENSEPLPKYTEAEIMEENKRIRHLRRLVDFALALIAQSPMSLNEAHRIVQAVREQAMQLFPGKEETFELLYTPRFRRLIAEKFRLL
jgi:hemerythrin-like domain-containing protein